MRAFLGLLIVFSSSCFSADWEVGILFLGAGESSEYQLDLDQNMIELARMPQRVTLGILREFTDRAVEYYPDPKSVELNSWDNLFEKVPVPGIPIPGPMKAYSIQGTVLTQPQILKSFLSRVFKDSTAHRLLIIYGHGEGFHGLKALPLLELDELLKQTLPERSGQPALDILWMESCFMSNIEAITQLAPYSRFYLASEDAAFAAGAPFDELQFLPEHEPQDGALELAQAYIESYSYSEKGSQRHVVETSAATISVIDTSRIPDLLVQIKDMNAYVKATWRGKQKDFERTVLPTVMEESQFVDLGSLAVKLGYKDVASTLEMKSSRLRQTSPRIPVFAPEPDCYLVFGYENWTKGDKSDKVTLEKLSKQLEPETFIEGPDGKKWPARSIQKRLYLNPFGVGLKEFNYYFVDKATGRMLNKPQSFQRSKDFFVYNAKTTLNPVLFYGYTQKQGSDAEIYNGISILNPTIGIPSLQYPKSKFFELTGWGS